MKNIPKMYQNNDRKVFNNNKRVFTSYSQNNNLVIKSTDDIRKKIMAIINSHDFIYRTKVKLVIDNTIVEKKIIGLSGNNVITIDNEYISIDKIKDIYK